MSFDDHLDAALDEYNARVSELENLPPSEELVEAYINRGTILMMMESYIAAMDDFDEAISVIEEWGSEGKNVDLGLYIRAYENRGQMNCGNDDTSMAADYRRIIARLPELNVRTRYFSLKDIVAMCLNCAEDLMDGSKWSDALPFIDKALDALGSRTGVWEDNSRAECYALRGEALDSIGSKKDAEEAFGKAVDIASYLDRHGDLEDRYRLVLDLVYRGDLRSDRDDKEGFVEDYVRASKILESMVESGRSTDTKLLVDIFQGIASVLVGMGKMAESEVYLLKSVKYGMPEMDEAITQLGIRKDF